MGDGVGVGTAAPDAKIPSGLLFYARPGTLFVDGVDWWTLGLGGPGSEISGVPFTCQVPSLVGTLLVFPTLIYLFSVVRGPKAL